MPAPNPLLRFFALSSFFLLLLVAFAPSPTAVSATTADPTASNNLFILLNTPTKADPLSLRTQAVQVNLSLLAPEQTPGFTVNLNLFPNHETTAVLTRRTQNPSGSTTWYGQLTNDALSDVVLVVHKGMLFGHLSGVQGTYVIEPLGENTAVHLIRQKNELVENLDPSQPDYIIPPDHDTDLQTIGPLAPTAADDGSLIDILVLYSTGVGTDVGTAVVEGYVDQFMAYTNLSYANSNIDQRVMLVGLEEVTYDDTGKDLSTTLGDVTIGNVPNAHTLRDTYHADLVVFLVRQTNPNSCAGLAWVQTVVSGAFEDTGYSTMNACSFGSGVFAHELGHNMGAQHDWYVNTNPNPYTYAHGHIDPTAGFRTIMSYSNKCNDLAVSCPRVAYFSNPNLTYSGAPMGIPGGTKSDCTLGSANSNTCDADVHLTLNNTAVNTSRFRPSGITWTGDTNTDWNNANNWEMPEGYNGNAGTVNRVPRQIDNVIIPSGAPRYPTLSSGNAYARELIIETGAQLTMNGGTLTVYGDWTEEGTGQFNGTAGTVIMGGALDQTITQNNPSNFHHLQLGDGSTQTIGLASNLDVNGDLTFSSGVRFEASNRTLRVGGDWQDDGNGFSADTSTVIFDGATQTANKVTTSTLLDEDFNQYTTCGCTTGAPDGWTREATTGFGHLFGQIAADGSAILWSDATEGWLHSPALYLQPGVDYTISFKQADHFGNATFTNAVYLGDGPNSANMLAGTLLGQSNDPPGSSYQTVSYDFTVNTAGVYYIGWYSEKSSANTSYGLLDDINLTGTQGLRFHNLQLNSGSSTSFAQNTAVGNNLTTQSNATANFGSRTITVDGTVSNNGTLRQQKSVGAGNTVNFLRLTNEAGNSVRYYGVQISDAASSLGSTTVAISGNQSCNLGVGTFINRCYDISPTTSASADVRFYFSEAERNGEAANAVPAWHWNGGDWEGASSTAAYTHSEAGTTCTTAGGQGCWIQATAVTSYSPFALGAGPNNPNAPDLTVWQGNTQLTNGASTVDYGTTTVGTPLVRTYTITNTGTAVLTLSNLAVTGDFEVASGFGNSSVSPGNSTTFAIRLTAVNTGTPNGTVSFNNNVSGASPFSFDVTGEVQAVPAPRLRVSEAGNPLTSGQETLNFGSTISGTAVTKTLTLANIGTADLLLSGFSVPTGYTYTLPLSDTLQPGQETALPLHLTAVVTGTFTGTAAISSNDDGSPFTIGLTGRVSSEAEPALVVLLGNLALSSNSGVDFGQTLLGTAVSQTITLENRGTADLILSDIALTGTGFSLTLPPSTTLAAGEMTAVVIQLDAASVGTAQAALTLTSNDPATPSFVLNVGGTVTAPPMTTYRVYLPLIMR